MLETIFTILGILFISALITLIIEVSLGYFDALNSDKKRFRIIMIVIFLCISLSVYRDNMRNKSLQQCINSSTTIEELKEKVEEKEFFGEN